jgi:hypothetical protein
MRLLLGLPSPCLPDQGEVVLPVPNHPFGGGVRPQLQNPQPLEVARESFVMCKASGALPFGRQAFQFMLAVRCHMTVFRAACK